ncbi:hypothetical protein Efla_004642 [Eimeria flavescens]
METFPQPAGVFSFEDGFCNKQELVQEGNKDALPATPLTKLKIRSAREYIHWQGAGEKPNQDEPECNLDGGPSGETSAFTCGDASTNVRQYLEKTALPVEKVDSFAELACYLKDLPPKNEFHARALVSGEVTAQPPYGPLIISIWKVQLGESGRGDLKRDISERISAFPCLKPTVNAVSKIKTATVDQLVVISEIVGLLRKTLCIAQRYELERAPFVRPLSARRQHKTRAADSVSAALSKVSDVLCNAELEGNFQRKTRRPAASTRAAAAKVRRRRSVLLKTGAASPNSRLPTASESLPCSALALEKTEYCPFPATTDGVPLALTDRGFSQARGNTCPGELAPQQTQGHTSRSSCGCDLAGAERCCSCSVAKVEAGDGKARPGCVCYFHPDVVQACLTEEFGKPQFSLQQSRFADSVASAQKFYNLKQMREQGSVCEGLGLNKEHSSFFTTKKRSSTATASQGEALAERASGDGKRDSSEDPLSRELIADACLLNQPVFHFAEATGSDEPGSSPVQSDPTRPLILPPSPTLGCPCFHSEPDARTDRRELMSNLESSTVAFMLQNQRLPRHIAEHQWQGEAFAWRLLAVFKNLLGDVMSELAATLITNAHELSCKQGSGHERHHAPEIKLHKMAAANSVGHSSALTSTATQTDDMCRSPIAQRQETPQTDGSSKLAMLGAVLHT